MKKMLYYKLMVNVKILLVIQKDVMLIIFICKEVIIVIFLNYMKEE